MAYQILLLVSLLIIRFQIIKIQDIGIGKNFISVQPLTQPIHTILMYLMVLSRWVSSLSPILFCIQLDGILNGLTNSDVECYMGGVFAKVLGQADDLKLLTLSVKALIILATISMLSHLMYYLIVIKAYSLFTNVHTHNLLILVLS